MKNYLKDELYELFQTNTDIVDWLDQGCLDGIWYWDL